MTAPHHFRFIGVLVASIAIAFTAWLASVQRNERAEESSALTRLLLAMEETGTGIVSVNQQDNKVTYANPTACRIFGFSDIRGTSMGLLVPDWQRTKPGISDLKVEGVNSNGDRVRLFIRAFSTPKEQIAIINTASDVQYQVLAFPDP